MKPHLTKRYEISNDRLFEKNITDIIKLLLDPLQRAQALCHNPKLQAQARYRAQLDLPLEKGRAASTTRACRRHGTTVRRGSRTRVGNLKDAICGYLLQNNTTLRTTSMQPADQVASA